MKTPDLTEVETTMRDAIEDVFAEHLPSDHKIPAAVVKEMCEAIAALISTTYSMGYRDGRTSR